MEPKNCNEMIASMAVKDLPIHRKTEVKAISPPFKMISVDDAMKNISSLSEFPDDSPTPPASPAFRNTPFDKLPKSCQKMMKVVQHNLKKQKMRASEETKERNKKIAQDVSKKWKLKIDRVLPNKLYEKKKSFKRSKSKSPKRGRKNQPMSLDFERSKKKKSPKKGRKLLQPTSLDVGRSRMEKRKVSKKKKKKRKLLDISGCEKKDRGYLDMLEKIVLKRSKSSNDLQ